MKSEQLALHIHLIILNIQKFSAKEDDIAVLLQDKFSASEPNICKHNSACIWLRVAMC